MKQNVLNALLGGALLLSAPLFTSCEDILGKWDRPTPASGGSGSSASEGTYLKWDAVQEKLVATAIPTATPMTSSTTTWSGVYIVNDDVEITDDVTLAGDVTIIILDGKQLSLASDKKIEYLGTTAYNLDIHAQSEGTSAGKLVIRTTSDTGYYPISLNGSLSIHGASIDVSATGANNEGIYVADALNVYGGEIKSSATGVAIMAGASHGYLNVYGGTVDSNTSGTGLAAISTYGDIAIYGGTVKAVAGTGSVIAATGAGMGSLSISGGTIIATGGNGSNPTVNASTVTIASTITKLELTNTAATTLGNFIGTVTALTIGGTDVKTEWDTAPTTTIPTTWPITPTYDGTSKKLTLQPPYIA